MKVPFMDLHIQYINLRTEINSAMQRVLDSSEFIGGSEKNQFEKSFAETCGVSGCVGVGNGTDAISISLRALGIGLGDEVIVPAFTFIASSEAVSAVGAKPVFVDVDLKTFLIDLQKLEDILRVRACSRGGKVKAVIVVHLYGRISNMTEVGQLAQKYQITIIEDSAQAHMAEWHGQRAGSYGRISTFSFYPGKNLGAFGDAGAIVSNDADLLLRARKIANHGRISKYDHEVEGFNSRLDGLQAAVLNVKLKYLPQWTRQRYMAALVYDELFASKNISAVRPEIPTQGQHVFHLYVMRVKNREEVIKKMANAGVQVVVHYPIALPNLKAYASMGHSPSDFKVASQLQNEVLSLPIYPEITREQQAYVAEKLIMSL